MLESNQPQYSSNALKLFYQGRKDLLVCMESDIDLKNIP